MLKLSINGKNVPRTVKTKTVATNSKKVQKTLGTIGLPKQVAKVKGKPNQVRGFGLGKGKEVPPKKAGGFRASVVRG